MALLVDRSWSIPELNVKIVAVGCSSQETSRAIRFRDLPPTTPSSPNGGRDPAFAINRHFHRDACAPLLHDEDDRIARSTFRKTKRPS
jgi:hypothetical protein